MKLSAQELRVYYKWLRTKNRPSIKSKEWIDEFLNENEKDNEKDN